MASGVVLRGEQRVSRLSARELAVATAVAAGLALKNVAAQLGISIPATSTYLTRAQRKLGQPSRWKMAVLLRGPLCAFRDLARRHDPELTPSEIQLGDLLLNGSSNAEIARANRISNKTAGRQARRLFRKLGVASRAELFELAARRPDPTRDV